GEEPDGKRIRFWREIPIFHRVTERATLFRLHLRQAALTGSGSAAMVFPLTLLSPGGRARVWGRALNSRRYCSREPCMRRKSITLTIAIAVLLPVGIGGTLALLLRHEP